jgi:hypothetical protein
MTLRRRGNVDNIWLYRLQHLFQIGKAFGDSEPLAQLFRHEQLVVANRHDLAIGNPTDGMHMLIGDFAATEYADAKHCPEIRDQTISK